MFGLKRECLNEAIFGRRMIEYLRKMGDSASIFLSNQVKNCQVEVSFRIIGLELESQLVLNFSLKIVALLVKFGTEIVVFNGLH